MSVYLDLVMILNFLVDLLLLISTNKLTGYPTKYPGVILAAGLGGVYGGICMLPSAKFLGSGIWCVVFLILMGTISFGLNRSAIQRTAVFAILSMSLYGIAFGLGVGNVITLVIAALLMLFLCVLGFQNGIGKQQFCRLELIHNNKAHCVTALIDTGNTLCDPVTGDKVIVAGPDVAKMLLGLRDNQLRDPITTMQKSSMPGLRLIPYRAVGSQGGFLLGIKLDSVKINGKPVGRLVAFTADVLGKREGYQALAGGII